MFAKVVRVIVESEEFNFEESEFNARRERIESELRDLQENVVKRLAVLTSPAGFEALLKRVTEAGDESGKVMASLNERIRREKVEKTGEFTEWLDQGERHLAALSQGGSRTNGRSSSRSFAQVSCSRL